MRSHAILLRAAAERLAEQSDCLAAFWPHANAQHCRPLRISEPFPSWLCLADLQYVNGLGELASTPGAAAKLTEDLPGLELGVRALAGCAEPRVSAVGFFL